MARSFFSPENWLEARQKIEESVRRLSEPVARSYGLEVVLAQYRREAQGWTLRIMVDRPGGVTVEDCGALSRELSDLLDIEDFIPIAYHLEVSSPGLDRPLIKPEDFQRFSGHEIKLKTRWPIDGRRNFKGILGGIKNDTVLLDIEGKRHELKWSLIEKANLVPSSDEPDSPSGHQ